MALIPQTVDAVRIPVLGAGSIVDGRGFVAALALGAQGIWMGTRFIASKEARAARQFKERIVAARGADTVVTRCYSGKPMRVITNPYVEEQERHPEEIKRFPEQLVRSAMAGVMNYVDDAATDPERTCMPAGQGIGGIDDIVPAGEIVAPRLREARRRRARRRAGAIGVMQPAARGHAPAAAAARAARKAATVLAKNIAREIHRRGLKPGDKLLGEQTHGRALRCRARLAARGAALPRAAGRPAHQVGPGRRAGDRDARTAATSPARWR